MDPLLGHDFELDADVVFAGTGASRSHCVLALLSLPRDDEVEDSGSSGEAGQVHVSVFSSRARWSLSDCIWFCSVV